MQKGIKSIGAFCFIYTLIVLLFILARNAINLTIYSLYCNTYVFAIFIFFSQMIMFERILIPRFKVNYGNIKYVFKKIIIINLILSIVIFIINVSLFSLYKLPVINENIFYQTIQLFLILMIISFVSTVIYFFSKSYNSRFIFLGVIYFVYFFESVYGSHFMLINFFYCYLQEQSVIINIIHYIFWILIIVLIGCLKHSRKKGYVYDKFNRSM